MQTKKEFCFKGVPLNPGDVIRITPAKEMKDSRQLDMVALYLLTQGKRMFLRVLLSQLDTAANENEPILLLEEDEIDYIEVVMEAGEAVPKHSGEMRFHPGQRIIFWKSKEALGGKVIGAFDEFVAVELNTGNIEVRRGTSRYFTLPPTHAFTPSSQDEVPPQRI